MNKKQNDFSTKTDTPSTAEYLKASIEEILDRLNKNPKGLESENGFIQAILMTKIAQNNIKQTRNLVFGTWALVAVTMFVAIVQIIVIKV